MSSVEVITSKKNKQKLEQQQIVSNEITNGCDIEDNETVNSQTLINKNIPDTNNKDYQVDVCMEPLLIQDCVDANQINETNGLFSDANDPISVCDNITNNNEICNNVIIDDIHESSAIIDRSGGFIKANLSLNLKNVPTSNDKHELVNLTKNKKFLESDDQIMNQIFFQTITITPTTDEDISLTSSKLLNDKSLVLSFSEIDSDINNEPVNFFSCKIDDDETFNPNYLDSVEIEGENLCSLNENYCSFSSIDYNTANIQLTQENQVDNQSPESEILQPETLHCEYADQMLKQRPSIVIDCYDSDSKTEEENVVATDEKINDCCFYFDQTIEEDDGDVYIDTVSKNMNIKIADLQTSNNACYDNLNVREEVDCKEEEDEISSNDESGSDDVQSIVVDDEGVFNESCLSVNSAIENFESDSTTVKKTVKKSVKTTKTTSKKSSKIISSTESSAIISSKPENVENSPNKTYTDNHNDDINEQQQKLQKLPINSFSTKQELSEQIIQESNIDENQQQVEIDTNDIEKRKSTSNKKKTKKKKADSEKENISVKSSFSKFDALQKKNLQSLQNGKGGENGLTPDGEKKCHACEKVVFQMEQIKAEKKFWHRSCFRCVECSKQLNVDTYQSHEGILYCKPHFKSLFSPKIVEDNNEPIKVRKHEMIILENQPIELPPDVVRSSDKADLGLDELHQINLRQRFQLFENAGQQEAKVELDKANNVKRSTSILSKLARFQAKGMDVGVVDDSLNGISYENSSTDEDELDDENHEDIELIRAKRAQKEKPMSFKEMYDIKSKFESGQLMSKEERREERKQELQNIRSRLFMGKQAKIKEMYQQAVAESEQTITSSCKKSEVEIGDKAKSIKEKFEKGEIYDENDMKKTLKEEEMAVFEKGISKQSRSLFLELDATASKSPNQESSPSANLKLTTRQTPRQNSQTTIMDEDIVRSDQKIDDVQIQTADIVSKFKFFETYQPPEKEKKSFRITPPRDYQGLTKLPSPEKEVYRDPHIARNEKRSTDQDEILELQKTTSKVLSMFRQMEDYKEEKPYGPKPLKRFTPPPESERGRFVTNEDSGPDYSDEDEECSEEESEEESNYIKSSQKDLDEFLKAAQSAERAKKLREKFEKWEENEIKKELNNSSINLYDEAQDEGQMETAKSLKARFEQMQNEEPKLPTNRPKVNRFV